MAARRCPPLLRLWLLLCLLFVHSLGPLAATRMALVRDGAAWAEVCSATGTRWVRRDAAPRPPGPGAPDSTGLHAPCWACLLGAQGMAPAPPAPRLLAPLPAASPTGHHLARGAEPRPRRGPAAPRAPPRPT